MDIASLLPLAPELFLAVLVMVLLIGAATGGEKASPAVNCAAALGLIVAGVGLFLFAPATKTVLLGGHVGVDAYGGFIGLLILVTSITALLLSRRYIKNEAMDKPEYAVLLLFATLGMMLMVKAESLLGLYMGLELQSLSLYVMAAWRRDDVRSSEAGLKYFVLGALASGLLLYGITLVYGASGTVLFEKLHGLLLEGKPPVEIVLGFVFILAAMSFKVSAVPFHMWAPDVYEGAPTSVTAFFAAVPKLAGLALLIKLLAGPFAGLAAQAQLILLFLSAASVLVGAFAAIAQRNIKRMLAYSSIGHVGFILMGLAAGGQNGLQAGLLYLLIYLPMTLGAFAILLGLRRDGVYLEQLSDLAGFSKTRPVLAALMSVFMFSMIGVPPLAGFFGKFAVLVAAVDAGFIWLAILGVCASVVSAYYYLRVVKIMYFDAGAGGFERVPGFGLVSVGGLAALFVLGFILQPEFFNMAVGSAVKALVG